MIISKKEKQKTGQITMNKMDKYS